MTCEQRAGEIVEALITRLAAVALPVRLAITAPVSNDHRFATVRTMNPFGQRMRRTISKHLTSSIKARR
jgi:hypothetical protein